MGFTEADVRLIWGPLKLYRSQCIIIMQVLKVLLFLLMVPSSIHEPRAVISLLDYLMDRVIIIIIIIIIIFIIIIIIVVVVVVIIIIIIMDSLRISRYFKRTTTDFNS